ncbi:caspase family protein [Actomonas aquatica]|uniref:Caspase family protein n=1 Tax=Actomonas aquatica TaxID=2866162 RepID=A0ABZ1C5X4_9BACT|nr:caspase family protein [Opitutus sp. WL0086]WRQ87132.1 caspase family protein [Opitutus sp. WL0086]
MTPYPRQDRPAVSTTAGLPRFARCLRLSFLVGCCISLTAAATATAAELPFGHWTDGSHAVDTGPAAELLPVSDQDSLILHDRQTLEPRFILRDGSAPVMFAPDGQSLLTQGNRLQRVDLTTGAATTLGPKDFYAQFFYQPQRDQLLSIVGAPNLWLPTSLQIRRLDLATAAADAPAAVTVLDEIKPIGLTAIAFIAALPARQPDHALLVLRDLAETGDPYDPRRFGDFHFVDLDLNTGHTTPVSSLTPPDDRFELSADILHWTSADRTLLHAASYPYEAYHLIDPYAGKITRSLAVPNVTWDTSDPRHVVATRRVEENGSTQHFRDYLEPGTLKTIRNVPIADASDYPEFPYLANLPSPRELLTPWDAPITFVKTRASYDQPYTLQRIDTATGEVLATFDGAGKSVFNYSGFAFHPSKPEFFAHTGDGDVHFFRFTSSGLQRQIRGSSATSMRYTPDGESLLSTEDYEAPISTSPASTFPFEPTFTYQPQYSRSALPEYEKNLTLSPSHTWLIRQTSTLATLYRFGAAEIAADLPSSPRDQPVTYAFSPDESQLLRLEIEEDTDYDTGEVFSPASLSLLSLERYLTDGYDPDSATLNLPHGQVRFLQWSPDGRILLLDLTSADLLVYSAADLSAPPQPLPLSGLEPTDLTGPSLAVIPDVAPDRVALLIPHGLALLHLTADDAHAQIVATPNPVHTVHQLGDGRHLVAKLANGTLAFIDLSATASSPRIAGFLEFYNDGADYLFRTPGGLFDATPALQADGVMLRGFVPVRLTQIMGQAYTPDLFTRLFAGLPVDDTPLADVILPPTVTLSGRITAANALRAQLQLRADSKVEDIAELRLFQNDKLVATVPPSYARGANQDIELDLDLVPANTFRLVAVTTSGLESLPSEVTLHPPEAALRRAAAAERPAQLHLLVIGVNEYRNPEYNLNFAEADAAGILRQLTAANRDLFAEIKSTHLVSTEATHDGILAAFSRIQADARPQDAFIFYFAGHGVMAKEDRQFYLVPHDVTRIYGASQSLSANGISADTLRQLSASIAARKQLFILDACNSGGALETFAQRGASQEKALAQLARATGTHWITAASADQFATEFADLGHGAFTHTLLEALNGRADTGDKRVTVNELKAFLESELPAVSQRHKGAPQYPSSYGYGQDFPIALLP